ncbi:MAG: serine/threonine protein kinase [Bacteroidetes bacterium]|nr:serine/threonine protein kinase [Bacteroidota bacterium]
MAVPPDRWMRVKALFAEVVALPHAERAPWFDEHLDGDAELRVEIERLLAAEADANRYFDTLGNKIQGTDDFEAEPPETIGIWRIVQEAGHGGMGRVYEAVREDGLFDQRVAIKVVESHAPRLVRRFQQERRILAGLEHPNICRLLDGGTLDDGRPYLVMEYVDGEPITAYADRNQLSVDERLILFAQVCEAVAYAHRHLIIHRDLKPSNVLVTDDGTAKLLDFGIATLMDEDGAPNHGLTQTGRRLLTPHYAAPEQILNQPITTATDVYALGILLYVLLTGHRPFGATGGSQHEIEQEVLKKEPTAPSTAVSKSAGKATDSGGQVLDLTKRGRRLRGDLDRIVLKALRKEPERRYASVEAFARDLQRHQEGLPVEARPATMGYRLNSFVKRHRTGVLITITGLILTSTLVTFFAVQITAERDRAEAYADRADQVNAFLTDILDAADDPTVDRSVLLKILEPATERAETELADDPDARAAVFHALGNLYARFGRWDLADSLLHNALLIRRELHTPPHPDIAESLYDIGYMYTESTPDSALQYFRAAAEMHRELHRGDHPELANSLVQWSRMMPQDDPEKRQRFEQGIEMIKRMFGERSPELAEAIHEYYVLGFSGGTPEELAAAFEEALDIYRETVGEQHPYALHAMNNLGMVLHDALGRHKEGLAFLARSVELGREVLPPADPDYATMAVNYGATLHERGQLQDADEVLSDIAETTARLLPENTAGIGQSHYWYGRNLLSLGRAEEAEAALRTAWEILRYTAAIAKPRGKSQPRWTACTIIRMRTGRWNMPSASLWKLEKRRKRPSIESV